MSRRSMDEKGAVLKDEFQTELPARLCEKEVKMCNYSDFVWNRGKQEGLKEGKREGTIKALVNLMESLKLTIDQALQALKLPESEWDEYRDLVRKHGAHPAQ